MTLCGMFIRSRKIISRGRKRHRRDFTLFSTTTELPHMGILREYTKTINSETPYFHINEIKISNNFGRENCHGVYYSTWSLLGT